MCDARGVRVTMCSSEPAREAKWPPRPRQRNKITPSHVDRFVILTGKGSRPYLCQEHHGARGFFVVTVLAGISLGVTLLTRSTSKPQSLCNHWTKLPMLIDTLIAAVCAGDLDEQAIGSSGQICAVPKVATLFELNQLERNIAPAPILHFCLQRTVLTPPQRSRSSDFDENGRSRWHKKTHRSSSRRRAKCRTVVPTWQPQRLVSEDKSPPRTRRAVRITGQPSTQPQAMT